MSDRQLVELRNCLDLVVDNRGKTPPNATIKTPYELIEVNAIRGSSKFPDYSAVKKFVKKETFDIWFRSGHPVKGDVLISTVGSIGEVVISEGRGCIAQNVVALRPKHGYVDSDFLYYHLKNPATKAKLLSLDISSVQPSIKVPHLLNTDILLPNLVEQRAIAHILGTLDDKIELNRKQNEILEAMARALFKAWFVDFEPVRAKMEGRWQPGQSLPGLPAHLYDLFPDRLVESELGEIPEGWEAKPLNMLLDTDLQRVAVSELTPDNYISTENMVINKGGVVSASSLPTAKTVPAFTKGDVLISNIRPYFKKIWFAERDGGRSADVLGFRSKEPSHREFLYSLLSQDEFFGFMMQTSKGAKMPRGDKLAIMAWPFAYPGQELCAAFSEVVKPFYSCVDVAAGENIELANLRDTLLPKLISGELRVKGQTLGREVA